MILLLLAVMTLALGILLLMVLLRILLLLGVGLLLRVLRRTAVVAALRVTAAPHLLVIRLVLGQDLLTEFLLALVDI